MFTIFLNSLIGALLIIPPIGELILTSSIDVLSLLFLNNNILFSFIPFQDSLLAIAVIVYSNAETDKLQILKDNKGKAGIYQWTHIESGKTYIGSAVDLSRRLNSYFLKSNLNRLNYMYICRALLHHDHSSFSLTILEYRNILDLSKDEARKLIISREQHYIDTLNPEFNLLPTAGSRLGSSHSEDTKASMSVAKLGENNPNYGKSFSAETLTKMSDAQKGKNISTEAKAKMSEAKVGEKNPMFGKTFSRSTDTKALMSITKGGGTIYVYDTQGSLVNTFTSAREAGKEFDTHHQTILKYAKNGNIFRDKWKLSTSLITKE